MMTHPSIQPWFTLINDLITYLPHQEAYPKMVEFLVQITNASQGAVICKREEQIWEIYTSASLSNESVKNLYRERIEQVFQTAQPLLENDPIQHFYPILSYQEKVRAVLCLIKDSSQEAPLTESDKELIQNLILVLRQIFEQANYHERWPDEEEKKCHLGLFWGNSQKMKKLYRSIEQVANTKTTVTILGPSGTGKELVARALHDYNHRRSSQALIDINCAAVPHELMESEFFGYEKGAFSGALETRKGKFELANGGTLFLDEIGELSLDLQAKLLRVIQEKVIWRVGGQHPIPVDVRIVAATQRDLEKEQTNGNFRSDLFYRLSVFPIQLPKLSERGNDVILLANHFLHEFAPEIPGFQPEVLTFFKKYPWPGNVRELKHCVERMALCHEGNGPLTVETLSLPRKKQRFIITPLNKSSSKTLDEAICETIRQSLSQNNFNKSRTAKELGIFRDRLDRLIQKYSLQVA